MIVKGTWLIAIAITLDFMALMVILLSIFLAKAIVLGEIPENKELT